MSLSVGQLCTVVYADGGVRVALPVEIATNGQRAFLADFGISGSGVPVRIQTINEIASTVPEAPHDPRLNRVVGTVARDASQTPVFVPLGVIPETPPTPTPSSTFFVVFADTAPVQASGASSPNAFYRRKAGEYDIEVTTLNFPERLFLINGGNFPNQIRWYVSDGANYAFLGSGLIREFLTTPTIAIREITRTINADGFDVISQDTIRTFNVTPGATRILDGSNRVIEFRRFDQQGMFYLYPTGYVFFGAPSAPRKQSITYESDDDGYFPQAIQQFRTNLDQWPTLPPAFVYHLPLSNDAVTGTLNQILPTGVIDTRPLEIIRGPYPTAGQVVASLQARASAEGIREVRFVTAMATVRAVNRVTALIDEVVGALRASYGQVVHSTTVANGNDWLGTLATLAENIPG